MTLRSRGRLLQLGVALRPRAHPGAERDTRLSIRPIRPAAARAKSASRAGRRPGTRRVGAIRAAVTVVEKRLVLLIAAEVIPIPDALLREHVEQEKRDFAAAVLDALRRIIGTPRM
jgi:hypothetical protein